MWSSVRIVLVLLWPVAFLAALYALGLTMPVLHLGRSYVVKVELPESGRALGLPEIEGPMDKSRPLVVIDAGHGGHDPGASGSGHQEKNLVLDLAKALRDRLIAQGGIRVAMTRDDDRFLALAERRRIARELNADLFLSIHADSAGQDNADLIGASVYTLSDKASDQLAATLADRENRADNVNGVALSGQSDAVSAILLDLSQRHAKASSLEFASLITREGEGTIKFLPQPRRSAAFAVLKSPDIPSVLLETGYISNPEQVARLSSAEGRKAFADVLARAVRIFFVRNGSALRDTVPAT